MAIAKYLFRAAIVACFLALPISLNTTTNAQAASDGEITVYMNHARILKFDEPIDSVIVGNSAITDVTISDSQTIILTAKSYGTTNLVILDANGVPMIDKRVVVTVDEANTVRVFRQVDRSVLSCSPICQTDDSTLAEATE